MKWRLVHMYNASGPDTQLCSMWFFLFVQERIQEWSILSLWKRKTSTCTALCHLASLSESILPCSHCDLIESTIL